MTVLGIDVDSKKVELLNSGQSYIRHVSEAGIREMVDEGKFIATTDFSRIKEVEAVIICVPTPLNKNREPDISFILETGRTIAPHLANSEPWSCSNRRLIRERPTKTCAPFWRRDRV